MAEERTHFEPFLHLAGVADDEALIAQRGQRRDGQAAHRGPDGFAEAGTLAWASTGHFLVVDVDEERIVVQPVGGVAGDGALEPIALRGPDGAAVEGPVVVAR